MRIIRSIYDMQHFSLSQRRQGVSISFVPTMGFLHAGHISLVKLAKKESEIVVLSIFVNKLQFGENEDFGTYPRNFEKDEALCRENSVDILFYPDLDDMFPENFQSKVSLKQITKALCGKSRPAHFDGVTTVLSKFFNIIQPTSVIFGQKDFQQVAVVKQMVSDLNFPIKILMAGISRENDGLAMSSRNKYLSTSERKNAFFLNQSLIEAKKQYVNNERSVTALKNTIKNHLNTIDCAIDYIDIVSSHQVKKINAINQDCVIAIAVYFGKTRLIDNILLEYKD